MSEVKTLVTLVLGGVFDHKELGDIDIVYEALACEALQRELATDSDDVHVELVSRIDYDAAQSQLAALREELAATEEMLQKANAGLVEWRVLMMNTEQRLADAERRNAVMAESLERIQFRLRSFIDDGREIPLESATVTCDIALRALNPNPEAASHDE